MLSLRPEKRESNWSGSVRFAPARRLRARTLAELQEAVAKRGAQRIRVGGSHHSFSPLLATEGIFVSLEHLALSPPRLDADGVSEVAAGLRLGDLNRELAVRGRGLENLGDIDVQTVAGAVSTGTHGTGADFGTLSTQLAGLQLVSADGALLELDADRDPALFAAAQTSLGALGVIVGARLRTLPAFRLVCRQAVEGVERAVEAFLVRARAHRHHEFFWFPHTAWAVTKTSDLAPPDRGDSAAWKHDLFDAVFENAMLAICNGATRLVPGRSAAVNAMLMRLARLAGESMRTGSSHRVFATARWVRFEEMEYAVRPEQFAAAFAALQALFAAERFALSMPVEVRYVKGDAIPLSPASGGDRVFIAVHVARGQAFDPIFRRVEELFARFDGRPHWGKRHGLGAGELARLYPQWKAFAAARDRLDPNRAFSSPYLERVLGP